LGFASGGWLIRCLLPFGTGRNLGGDFRLDALVIFLILLMDEEPIVLERQARYGTENIG
jgi:hypothetical protein